MTPATSAPEPGPPARSGLALAVAGLAALLASGCCVAPLLLALAGISGAWIGQMRRIEPFSPWLMALSFAALAFAGWLLYRRPAAGAACAAADGACWQASTSGRRWFWAVAFLALVPLAVPLVAPWFY